MKAMLLLSIFLAVFSLYTVGVLGTSCLENLATYEKLGKAREACIKSLHLNSTDVVEVTDLKEKKFHDKCLINCTLESMNFMKNGTILKDKILEQLKREATTEVYEKLEKVVNECVEVANTKHHKKDKSADGKEGTSPSPVPRFNGTRGAGCQFKCKKAAKFAFCMAEKNQNLC